MRIGFAGVAHSHPFSDARNLLALGGEVAGVWDLDDPESQEDFVKEFDAVVLPSLEALLDSEIDVLVATPRPSRAAELLSVLVHHNIPCFMNKTIACSGSQLAAVSDLVDQLPAPFFTSSVIRFAPELANFAKQLESQQLLSIHCEVQHDIAPFLEPNRNWQDDPAGAGGTMINMGIHGWEMLDVALSGARLSVLEARLTRAQAKRTSSEDAATVLAITDENVPVSLRISGAPGPGKYSLHATTANSSISMELGSQDPMIDHGFVGLAEVLFEYQSETAPPVPWSRTQQMYSTMIHAAETARQHHPDWFQPGNKDRR